MNLHKSTKGKLLFEKISKSGLEKLKQKQQMRQVMIQKGREFRNMNRIEDLEQRVKNRKTKKMVKEEQKRDIELKITRNKEIVSSYLDLGNSENLKNRKPKIFQKMTKKLKLKKKELELEKSEMLRENFEGKKIVRKNYLRELDKSLLKRGGEMEDLWKVGFENHQKRIEKIEENADFQFKKYANDFVNSRQGISNLIDSNEQILKSMLYKLNLIQNLENQT